MLASVAYHLIKPERATQRLLVILLVLIFSRGAVAWGYDGHRIIAGIADQHLTAPARAAVASILSGEDLADASLWADEMRSSNDNPEFWSRYAAGWHYVNIEPGQPYSSSAPAPRGDAYVALQTFVAILQNAPVPESPVREGLEFYFGKLDTKSLEVKRFALRFMLHILGDLQQPLHSGRASDRGGNDVQVLWLGKRSNLHTLRDGLLLDHADRSTDSYIGMLNNRISRAPAADIRRMENADPLAWIDESQGLLQRIYARHRDNTDFGDDYAAEFVPSVEAQLVKGGLRTAFILNSIFGGRPVGVW